MLARDTDLADVGPVDAVLDAVPIGAAAIAPVRAGGVALFTRGSVELPGGLDLRVEMPLVDSDPAALEQLTAQGCRRQPEDAGGDDARPRGGG